MQRTSTFVHVLRLVLIALLAWPWDVALSAAEAAQPAFRRTIDGVEVAGAARGPRLVHPGCAGRQNSPVIAPDYDRDGEEGDDSTTAPLSTDISTAEVAARTDFAASSSHWSVLLLRPIPPERLCRLRC